MAKSGAQPNYLPFSQLDEFGVLSQVLLQQNLLSPLSPPTTPRQDVLIQSNNRVVQLKLPEYPTSQQQRQQQQQQQQQQRIPITSTLTSAPIPVAAAAVNSTTELPSLKGNCPVPVLQNIVSAVNLGVPLDLKKIAREARNAEYNPRRFAAVVLRLREPKATALVFSSGKMVVNGARSEDDARLASRKFARIIQKLGYPEATFKEFKIHNVVASSDIRMRLRLNDLRMGHRAHTDYEPELFPGLIYRMQKPRVTLLIFHSGKIVLTGARTRLDVYQAFEAIYPVLVQYGRPLS